MRRVFGGLVACICLVTVAFVAPASAGDARIHAVLNGPNERPGPGDADAWGRAQITISDSTNRLCLSLQYANVDGSLTGLHIHLAPPSSAGPVVVPFATPTAPTNGVHQTCVNVESEALLDNIALNPSQYYINLHSTVHPPGAIRGQLQPA